MKAAQTRVVALSVADPGVGALVEDDQVNAAGVEIVGQVDEVFQR